MNTHTKLTYWDRIMMAVTFAEANEPDIAREFLDKAKEKKPENRPENRTGDRPELRAE